MTGLGKAFAAIVMAVSAAALVAMDQWTKALAAGFLAGKGAVRLVGGFVMLIYARNRGAFLSLGSGLSPTLRFVLLIVCPLAALAFLGWAFLSRGMGERKEKYAVVVLIAAGGVGNLVDRLLYGEVRDFLNFGIGRLRTGIMNLADLYILAALIVMIVAMLRSGRAGKAGGRTDSSGSSS